MSKKTQCSSEYKTMLLSRFHESGMSTRETVGILTTIVKTAVANGLYSDEYIIRILKNRNEVISNPEKFLPWNPWMREGIEIKRLRSSIHRTKIGFSG